MVTDQLVAQARAGDDEAFRRLIEPYQRELHLHCYRLLGSLQDAEDTLQETMVAAWRGLAGYQERASMRTWLYRIATNRCLNALRDSERRPLPTLPPMTPPPTRTTEPLWMQPYPDVLLAGLPDDTPGPEAVFERREAVSLAFITAVQSLPPRQRAVLVLRDVLGYRAAEVAELLDTTEESVTSALKRARAAIPRSTRAAALPTSAAERDVIDRFADAIERGDAEAMVKLLTDDAWLTMPPAPLEYQGHDVIANFIWLVGFRSGTRRYRLIRADANGQPGFGCYIYDGDDPVGRAHGVLVLTLDGDQISMVTRFVDNTVLPFFGLPRSI
jgi:RNA polymerase sigma-70 factor (ECF subfamily)